MKTRNPVTVNVAAIRALAPEPADPRAADLARRVWAGQSPDLWFTERIKRVRAAVECQGLSMRGVLVTPVEGVL